MPAFFYLVYPGAALSPVAQGLNKVWPWPPLGMEVGQVGQNAVQVVVVVQTHLLTVVSERFGTKDFLVVSSLAARSRFENKNTWAIDYGFRLISILSFSGETFSLKDATTNYLKATEGSQVYYRACLMVCSNWFLCSCKNCCMCIGLPKFFRVSCFKLQTWNWSKPWR